MLSLTNHVLFEKAKNVTSLNHLPQLFLDMLEVMVAERGVGLAAPQVGIPERVFIMRRDNGQVTMCVNPVIKSPIDKNMISHEGCLSHPGVFKEVRRDRAIIASYYDMYGAFRLENMFDEEAYIFQHEMDHLNGKTITSESVGYSS